MNGTKTTSGCLALLSQALLTRDGDDDPAGRRDESVKAGVIAISTVDGDEFSQIRFSEVWTLANSHHVILRAFPILRRNLDAADSEPAEWPAEWIDRAIVEEKARTQHALSFFQPICQALEIAGDVVVIKSLDHWPDLGSDLDLFTNADAGAILSIMRQHFQARVAPRSWGDRLANKWNFIVPGLPELVEVHVGRLGQTGEQIALNQSLIARAETVQFGSHSFRVPAPEGRMIIGTLQRMYRHFYVRLCDIVDNARLVDAGSIDYGYLKSMAMEAGLWQGVATYLVIVSDYVKSYRGADLLLPAFVRDAALFGNELVRFRRNFLRIPIFPQAANLYASEWKRLLLNGEIKNALRLSLLPGLATAAALEFKITGSDKGIW
jgi:hypothetical protein